MQIRILIFEGCKLVSGFLETSERIENIGPSEARLRCLGLIRDLGGVLEKPEGALFAARPTVENSKLVEDSRRK